MYMFNLIQICGCFSKLLFQIILVLVLPMSDSSQVISLIPAKKGGINFHMMKVDQICMLCSMWKLKKYRSAARYELCLFIAQNGQLGVVYEAQGVKVKAKVEELQEYSVC
jgi:hypothetical protein